jgi:hypothetical protein
MRLSTLALFIALPAAAYAQAGAPAPNTNTGSCISQTQACSLDIGSPSCCSDLVCKSSDGSGGALVCLIAHLLRFMLCTEPNAAMPPASDKIGRRITVDMENVQVMVIHEQGSHGFGHRVHCTYRTCGRGVLCSPCLSMSINRESDESVARLRIQVVASRQWSRTCCYGSLQDV